MHSFRDLHQPDEKKMFTTTVSPNITINNYHLEIVDEFTNIGSIVISKLSLYKIQTDEQVRYPLLLNASKHVCGKTPNQDQAVWYITYSCTLLYRSESWTTCYSRTWIKCFLYSLKNQLRISQMSMTRSCAVQKPTMFTISAKTALTCPTNERQKNF